MVGDSLSAAGRKLDADLSRMGKSVSEATGELGSSLAGAAAAGGGDRHVAGARAVDCCLSACHSIPGAHTPGSRARPCPCYHA